MVQLFSWDEIARQRLADYAAAIAARRGLSAGQTHAD
jgi:hypothetical protein